MSTRPSSIISNKSVKKPSTNKPQPSTSSTTLLATFLNNNINKYNLDTPLYSTKGKKSGVSPVIPSTFQFKSVKDTTNTGITIDLNNYKCINELKQEVLNMPGASTEIYASKINDPFVSDFLRVVSEQTGNDRVSETARRINNYFDIIDTKSSIKDHITPITEYMNNNDKLRTKIFNNIFPHDTHKHGDKENELPKGVNVKYLQHMTEHYDTVLRKYIHDGVDEEHILTSVREEYINKLSLSDDQRVQLYNPMIVTYILEAPKIVNRSGVETVDVKWINKLNRCSLSKTKSRDVIQTSDVVTLNDVELITKLVKELNLAKSLIKQLEGSINARELIVDETKQVRNNNVVKPTTKYTCRPAVVDLKKCYVQFNDTIDRLTRAQLMLNDKLESGDHNDMSMFVDYFVSAAKVIAELLFIEDPIKPLIKNSTMRLNKKLRLGLKALIGKNDVSDDDVTKLAGEFTAEWFPESVVKDVVSSDDTAKPALYVPCNDIESIETYSKISKSCGVSVKKEIRIALGIGIVDYVLKELRVIMAANIGKSDLKIYLKL